MATRNPVLNWTRVTPRNRCPICEHDGWCSFTGDGRSVKCMRVLSDRPTRDGGFMHTLGNGQAPRTFKAFAKLDRHPVSPLLRGERLLSGWRSRQTGELERLAATLNVTEASLRALGCVWAPEHRAFAFPMYDAKRRVVGIRLRNDVGDKWAVVGSKHGLFLNFLNLSGGGLMAMRDRRGSVEGVTRGNTATGEKSLPDITAATLIVEGPTDTAAALDLGFNAIGRPANVGCEDMIAAVVKGWHVLPLFIIADNDDRPCPLCKGKGCSGCEDGIMRPGQRGARRLKAKLPRARIITLPAKDLRDYKNRGGTKELFEQIVAATV